jgi:hypothetical protein
VMQQCLQDAETMLLGLVTLLRRQVQSYGRLCEQAKDIGVQRPVGARRVMKLRAQLADWEREHNEGAA